MGVRSSARARAARVACAPRALAPPGARGGASEPTEALSHELALRSAAAGPSAGMIGGLGYNLRCDQ